jgi:hypothetical protein
MQYVDPPATNILFDEVGTVLENQSAQDRVSSIFRILGPRFLAAELIRPRVFIFVSVTSVVNAQPVIRDVFEKKTIAHVQPNAIPIMRYGWCQGIKKPVDPDKLPWRSCIDVSGNR